MASLEFHLARITADSTWRDPRDPPGGRATLTEDDIRAAVSLATEGDVFQAMIAKYCQSRRAAEILVSRQAKRSALEFLARYPTWRLTGKINQGLAESAVLFFLNPDAGQRRGDAGQAAHLGVSRNTWARYYRDHWKAITAELFELEVRGISRIRAWLA